MYSGFLLTAAFVVGMVLRHWNVGLGAVLFSLGQEKRLCQSYLADGSSPLSPESSLVFTVGPIGAPPGSISGSGCWRSWRREIPPEAGLCLRSVLLHIQRLIQRPRPVS